MGIDALVTPAPAAAARGGARLRSGVRRYGGVLLALVALAGTAAGRVSVPVPGAQSAGGARTATATTTGATAPRKLLRADVMVVAQHALPARDVARVPGCAASRRPGRSTRPGSGSTARSRRCSGSTRPRSARSPPGRPPRPARCGATWRKAAIAVSYTMGKQDKLPLGGTVTVAGRTLRSLRVAGFGTVGIGGVDAVVSAGRRPRARLPGGQRDRGERPGRPGWPRWSREIKKRGCRTGPWSSRWSLPRPAAPRPPRPAGSSRPPGPRPAPGHGQPALTAGGAHRHAQGRGQPGRHARTSGAAPGRRRSTAPGWCSGRSPRPGWSCRGWPRTRPGPGPQIPFSQPGRVTCSSTTPIPTAPDYISHVAIYLGNGHDDPGARARRWTSSSCPVDAGQRVRRGGAGLPGLAAQVAASPVG